MKQFLKFFTSILLACTFVAGVNLNLSAQGWQVLTTDAPDLNYGGMLLLTDGSILCKTVSPSGYGTIYDKLTPDIHGSYVNGTWSQIAPMNYDRWAYSSQILMDGRVYVAGGENGTGGSAGEVYDPLTNVWTETADPNNRHISDANSMMLPDGRVLLGIVDHSQGDPPYQRTLIYDPATDTYVDGPLTLQMHYEVSWVKLPDNSILFADIDNASSERYIPSSNTWIADGPVPVSLYDPFGTETGPAFLLPNGQAFFLGGSGHTAYYTPTGTTSPGTWTPGPDIPDQGGPLGAADAPAAMMVNGKILCALSPIPTSSTSVFHAPTYFYEFDYTNPTTPFTLIDPPYGGGMSINQYPYLTNFLDLPDGTVLFSNGTNNYYVYTPTSSPLAAGKPTITSVTNGGCTYIINGTLFNGISQGAAFGDDWQMATNYPIVRLTAGTNVYYCRTSNWSSTGVQTGSTPESVEFTVNSLVVPNGTYNLVVIANGISSDPDTFTFASTGSADLWMMDNPVGEATQYQDFGFEKDDRYNNAPGSEMWTSGDIWVSPTQLGSPWANVLGDQSLSYDGSTDNYVYVTVRNRGCSASSGTETLDLHWTKTTSAGVGDWPIYWDGSKTLDDVFPGCTSNITPVGGLIIPDGTVYYQINGGASTSATVVGGEITIHAINPSDVITFQIPWIGEEPSNYFCLFPGETIPDLLNNEEHFCLLARIQTSATAPFGMTYAEGNPSNVWTNTYNNNKIAWHNISVICSGCRMGGAIVRNPEPNQLVMKLLFNVPPEESTNSFLNYGTVKVDLPHNLFQKWVDGGSVGAEYELCDDTIIKITGPNAWIGNITLDSLEADVVETVFDQYIESPNQCQFNYDIAQYDSSATDTLAHVTGGVRFLINTCSSAPAPRQSANNSKVTQKKDFTSFTKLYPNPTTGDVTVLYHLSSGNGVLQLYDVIGKMVGSFRLDGNNNAFEFDASYLCCGVFEYRVMDNESLEGQGKLAIIR